MSEKLDPKISNEAGTEGVPSVISEVIDSEVFRIYDEFPGYGFGSFKDTIFFAVYKNIPKAAGSNEQGIANADIALKELIGSLSQEDKVKLYFIYQGVMGDRIDDKVGGQMVVDILFRESGQDKDSRYLVE